MRQVGASEKRDPAPSRLAYRLHRLALTPTFRFFLRRGLPLLSVAAIAGVVLADQERRDALQLWVGDLKAQIQNRDEFMLRSLQVDGASPGVAEDIAEVLSLDLPVSSFDLDLDEMQRRIGELDAVARAALHVRPGGVLEIDVIERQAAIVWRYGDRLELLDRDGRRVAPLTARAARADLPLIAGAGADARAAEALRLVAAAQPLEDRLRGLVRVGQRRWDVVLDRGQRILLPEKTPVVALEHVLALHQAQELLARDVVLVDIRNPRRPTVRLAEATAEGLRKIKMDELGAE